MNGFLTQILLVIVIGLLSAGLLLWSAATIRYRVTPTHLRVAWLGLPVRWLRLQDIQHIGHRPVFWAERWPNTLFDSRRMLVIRRRRGLFRHLIITPQYPFEFKASLQQACQALLEPAHDPGRRPSADGSVHR